MNSSTGQNRSRLSTRRCKDGVCAKCGCPSGDQVKCVGGFMERFEEIPKIGKYYDFFEAMLTAMKKLNGDVHVSESEVSDSLNMVDHLKGLFCKIDEASRSGLPATDSSTLYRRHRELIETFSHLDKVVGRIERLFSRKTMQNLTMHLIDYQKNIGFQVGLKEIQCVEYMERKIVEILDSNDRLLHVNKSVSCDNRRRLEDHKKFARKYDSVCNRLKSLEDLLIKIMKENYLRKRRNSW